MEAELPARLTVRQVMAQIGINDEVQHNGGTNAERVAREIFGDSFHTAVNMELEEINQSYKYFSGLTVASGKINISPIQKRRIKAFFQWCRSNHRMNRDSSAMTYDVDNTSRLLDEFATCQKFEEDKKLADILKPQPFNEVEQQWNDFRPLLENYLGSIPGRMGLPLNYITRINNTPLPAPAAPILEQYVRMAPHAGPSTIITMHWFTNTPRRCLPILLRGRHRPQYSYQVATDVGYSRY